MRLKYDYEKEKLTNKKNQRIIRASMVIKKKKPGARKKESKTKTGKSVAPKRDSVAGARDSKPKNKPKSNGKHPGGRPPLLSDEERAKLAEDFAEYINKTEIPIIKEFAYRNNLLSSYLYDWQEFPKLLKICMEKKESNLELMALRGKINPSMAIFSLKQIGWSDKVDLKADVSHKPAIDYSKLTIKELKELECLLEKAKPDESA